MSRCLICTVLWLLYGCSTHDKDASLTHDTDAIVHPIFQKDSMGIPMVDSIVVEGGWLSYSDGVIVHNIEGANIRVGVVVSEFPLQGLKSDLDSIFNKYRGCQLSDMTDTAPVEGEMMYHRLVISGQGVEYVGKEVPMAYSYKECSAQIMEQVLAEGLMDSTLMPTVYIAAKNTHLFTTWLSLFNNFNKSECTCTICPVGHCIKRRGEVTRYLVFQTVREGLIAITSGK